MKSWPLLLALAAAGCTRKYVDYDAIHKLSFGKENASRPVGTSLRKGRQDRLGQCFNQWFFSSNAEKEKDAYLPRMVQVMCPGSEWLLDARVTTHWWTVIFFSRACAEVTASCPDKR